MPRDSFKRQRNYCVALLLLSVVVVVVAGVGIDWLDELCSYDEEEVVVVDAVSSAHAARKSGMPTLAATVRSRIVMSVRSVIGPGWWSWWSRNDARSS